MDAVKSKQAVWPKLYFKHFKSKDPSQSRPLKLAFNKFALPFWANLQNLVFDLCRTKCGQLYTHNQLYRQINLYSVRFVLRVFSLSFSGLFLTLVMTLNSISLLFATLVINIKKKGERKPCPEVPRVLLLLCKKFLAKITCTTMLTYYDFYDRCDDYPKPEEPKPGKL